MDNIETSGQTSILQSYPPAAYLQQTEDDQGRGTVYTNGFGLHSQTNEAMSPNFKSDFQTTNGAKDNALSELEGENGRTKTDLELQPTQPEASDTLSKGPNRNGRDPQSQSQKGSSVPHIGKTISSDNSKSIHSLLFPQSFKFNVEYASVDEIFRILRKEEVQIGLPPKFMKEISPQRSDSNQNICIKCRLCSAYVDFKPVNGKYEVSILRNKHSHTKEVRKGNSKEDQDKNKEMVPMRPKNTAQNTFQNANQFVAVSSVKTEMREAGSSLKDFLDKMRTTAPTNSTIQRMPSKEIQPTPINRPDVASSFMNPQPTRVTINKFKALQDYLLGESHELVVEQGREPPGSYPEIMVVVSPTMKRNFERFGDLVNFHIVDQPILETSETGHNFRLGVFTVYGNNRKMLLAGMTFLCRETAAATRTVFEFFLKIHNKQPESISTNHSKEVCLALSQLQDEGVYKGIHVIDPRQAIQTLENGLKVRNKLTRQIIDLCNKVVIERSKVQAEKIISDIEELIQAQDQQTQKVTLDFLNQKEKICISSLPPAFLGINNPTHNCHKIFDEILAKKTNSAGRPMSIENLCKQIVALDNELLDQSFEKLIVYLDPIEEVFQDDQLRLVRESVDTEIFKVFLQNYIEATCYNQIKAVYEDSAEIENTFTGQIFTLSNWTCICAQQKRTGLPCSHLLCVAKDTPGFNYFQLISKRWRENEHSQVSVESGDLDNSAFEEEKQEEGGSDIAKDLSQRHGSLKGSMIQEGQKSNSAPVVDRQDILVACEDTEMRQEEPDNLVPLD